MCIGVVLKGCSNNRQSLPFLCIFGNAVYIMMYIIQKRLSINKSTSITVIMTFSLKFHSFQTVKVIKNNEKIVNNQKYLLKIK